MLLVFEIIIFAMILDTTVIQKLCAATYFRVKVRKLAYFKGTDIPWGYPLPPMYVMTKQGGVMTFATPLCMTENNRML